MKRRKKKRLGQEILESLGEFKADLEKANVLQCKSSDEGVVDKPLPAPDAGSGELPWPGFTKLLQSHFFEAKRAALKRSQKPPDDSPDT